MADRQDHSRRDFLKGKAAVRTLAEHVVDLAESWVGSTTELIADRFPITPALHLEASRRAMACEFAIRYHETDRHLTDPILEAFDLIETIEGQLSIYRDTSDVQTINRNAAHNPLHVDAELFSLLQTAKVLYETTGGAFDITGTPLSRCWGFLKREGRLPTDAEIAAAMTLVGMSQVILDANELTIEFQRPGVEINFNAIGKGYSLDRVAKHLEEQGARDYVWHGGRSSILARGVNRGETRDCWSIGLRDPLRPEDRLAEFHLRDCALGTSGGATQYFEHEGQRYSHVLDPRSGWPAQGVFTATAIAPTAAEADALSTAAFVLGPNAISDLCRRRTDVKLVLVCPADTEFGINVVVGNMDSDSWTPMCDERMMTVV